MRFLNKLAYSILLIFWTLSLFIQIDYSLLIMYIFLGYIVVDEYLIYNKDKKEIKYLIQPRRKITQKLLPLFFIGIIIISVYYLDRLNYLKIREIRPQEGLLQSLIWGIIIIKGLIFSDYQSGYKFMTTGFKKIGLVRKKYDWSLLTKSKIDYEKLIIELTFKNEKTIKIMINKTFDKRYISDIEQYLEVKTNNVA